MNYSSLKTASATTLATLSILALAACSSGSSTSGTSSDSTASASNSATTSTTASALEFSNTWVKATTANMTGVFGTITNTSDHEITLVSVESDASHDNQLHTTEIDATTGTSTMKQVDSLTLKAGQSLELAPGADHIMLMGMHCALPAGTETTIKLKDTEGNTYSFTAQARDYSGAKEEYAPGGHTPHAHDEGTAHGEDSMEASPAVVLPNCN